MRKTNTHTNIYESYNWNLQKPLRHLHNFEPLVSNIVKLPLGSIYRGDPKPKELPFLYSAHHTATDAPMNE